MAETGKKGSPQASADSFRMLTLYHEFRLREGLWDNVIKNWHQRTTVIQLSVARLRYHQRWPLLGWLYWVPGTSASFRIGPGGCCHVGEGQTGTDSLIPEISHVPWPGVVIMACGGFLYLMKRISARSGTLHRVLCAIIGDNQGLQWIVIAFYH